MARISFGRIPPSRLIIVRLRVEGVNAGSFRDLPVGLDTGASLTLIPPQIAEAVGYDMSNPKEVRPIITGGGRIFSKVITVRQLTAIGETVEDIDVLCHDLPNESKVRGLLGLNFLERFDINISFSTGTIEICPY